MPILRSIAGSILTGCGPLLKGLYAYDLLGARYLVLLWIRGVVMARIWTQTGGFYYAKYQFKRSILENDYTTEDYAAALFAVLQKRREKII